jgi:hypothetical protein
MAYKLKVVGVPTKVGNGMLRCNVEVYKDGVLVDQRTEDRAFPRIYDADLDTSAKRIAAFTAGFSSEPEALQNQETDLSEREKAIVSDMSEAELAKLNGYETPEF